MILADVNVLAYAHRTDAVHHREFLGWLNDVISGDSPFAVSEFVLSSFLRIVTHPKIFNPPSSLDKAVQFADLLRSHSHAILIQPGARHWGIFTRLCRQAKAKGNLVPDAYLAALAIESGSDFMTTDKDYSRFEGLHWRHPLES